MYITGNKSIIVRACCTVWINKVEGVEAVYGAYEPDGILMTSLDANHGHNYNGEYHYHGTANAPYMIGNMVGQVTEDASAQIIPQAAASPVRPAQTPLNGALISGVVPNGINGYILSYVLNNQNYQVSYSWTSNGLYTFNFIFTQQGNVHCQNNH